MDNDEFKMVDSPVDTRVVEIQMLNKNGSPYGVARVWPNHGKFGWAHPDGTEGLADSFEKAVEAINAKGA